jgi:adenosylcobinamide-phosphate synthase
VECRGALCHAGFRQFSHHFTRIRDALDAGDEFAARQALADWQQVDASEVPRSEVVRHVIEYSVLAAHRHVFGVLFWFSILSALGLGPLGAILYRMAEYLSRAWSRKGRKAAGADQRAFAVRRSQGLVCDRLAAGAADGAVLCHGGQL